MAIYWGSYRSGQTGLTVNQLAYAFGGSNPPLPTGDHWVVGQSERRIARSFARALTGRRLRASSSVSVWLRPGATAAQQYRRYSRPSSSGAEHNLGKVGVTGSIPVSGSNSPATVCRSLSGIRASE